jgi:hypothetical protein
MSTKAAAAPTCKLCKADHWSHEPHRWPSGAPEPTEAKAVPIRPTTKERDHELELWKARAIKAEAELAELRKANAERDEHEREATRKRVKRYREKAKP